MDVGQAFDFTLNSAKELHGLWEIYFFGITQLQQSLHPFGTPSKIQVILFGAPDISDQLQEIHPWVFPRVRVFSWEWYGTGVPTIGGPWNFPWFGNMKQSQSKGQSYPWCMVSSTWFAVQKGFLFHSCDLIRVFYGFLVSQKFFRKPEAFSLCNVTNPPFESIAGYTGYSLGYHPRVEVVWDPPLEGKMLQGMAARVYLLLYQLLA